jgi:hypothetical protein
VCYFFLSLSLNELEKPRTNTRSLSQTPEGFNNSEIFQSRGAGWKLKFYCFDNFTAVK